ncbi:pyridoxal phosphate-dependent aminotransferase [Bordetella bronchiseptica]|uniref:pyridoxal phosphate-dependent aminotransferase n=7 Tax=Bordetella bronchiseptica TaxID=518 RepID=UPI0030030D41
MAAPAWRAITRCKENPHDPDRSQVRAPVHRSRARPGSAPGQRRPRWPAARRHPARHPGRLLPRRRQHQRLRPHPRIAAGIRPGRGARRRTGLHRIPRRGRPAPARGRPPGRVHRRPVDGANELIITPGTQGALFLAIASSVTAGDKVAIVRPDYFANRKLVEFLGGEIVPVDMRHLERDSGAGLDLDQLEAAFKAGVRTFLFSNPNNPAGVVYSPEEIAQIADLARHYDATVIVDQLYSRLLYTGTRYTHLRALPQAPANVITIMGPSKTESLSGYRLGVAFGAAHLIDRMEKLQAIVSLRAPGYCQAVLRTWFQEPAGWMNERIAQHQAIRDDLIRVLRAVPGLAVRAPEAGSYLFPRLPRLAVGLHDFVRILRTQAGVTVTPGTEFSPHADDSIRLNFSQNHAAAVQAIERTAQLIERYRA